MPATDATGFADDELERLFAPLADLDALGIAVSGGPDSTALLHLLARWAARRTNRPRLHVLTVDHGLRPASAGECDAVVRLADTLGLAATRLCWLHDGAPPTAGIQAAARDARYRLLAAEARRLGLAAVALAHTRDDQAETFLIRLQRGSGVAGLSGMPPRRVVDGMVFERPLLDVPKRRLVAHLAAAGIAFADDPSNRSNRFLRARLRGLMPALADVGLDAARLAGTAARLARAEAALRIMTGELAARAVTDHGGACSADRAAVAAAPDEIALRLLSETLRRIRPGAHPPRLDPLERWLVALRSDAPPPRLVFGGVALRIGRDRLWVYAEAGRAGFERRPVDADGEIVWDGRLRLAAEGLAGRPALVVAGAGRPDLPAEVAASLPRLAGPDGGIAPAGAMLRPLAWSAGAEPEGG